MEYRKYQPVVELRPFVECYFVWEGEAKEKLEVQSPPNCFSAIVFNYADPYLAYQDSPIVTVVPSAFVCGMFTSNYHLVLKGRIGMIGIVFRASALHNFFGLRMSHLVNSRMTLPLLLKDEGPALKAKIKFQATAEDRVKELDQFLLPRLPVAKSKLNIIDDALTFIDGKKGIVTVEEVAAQFKISRRYLEKQFLDKVGVSPKFYARIKRFTSLSKVVAYSKKFNWQDLVFEYGLHDQSHLVKEFLEFNKMSPSEYLESHHELIRHLKPR